MNKKCFPLLKSLTGLCLVLTLNVFSCSNAPGDPMLELNWINPPNSEETANIYLLQIVNRSPHTLNTANWKLYFHSIHSLRRDDGSAPLTLKHYNGDYYSLDIRSDLSFKPGDTLNYQLNSSSAFFKYSSLPHGFYSRFITADGQTQLLEHTLNSRGSIRPEDSRRFSSDNIPLPTPETRFAENQYFIGLAENAPDLPLIPSPASIQLGRIPFQLPETFILTQTGQPAQEMQRLMEILQEHAPLTLSSDPWTPSPASVMMSLDPDCAVGPEGYALEIDPDHGIRLKAAEKTGLYYALQSLSSLLAPFAFDPGYELMQLYIEDRPRFSYRGLHIDVARNWHSLDEILTMIDVMAMYKLNRLHLHICDDEAWRVEIPSLPELTAYGARRGHTADENDHLIPQYGSGPLVQEGQFFSEQDFRTILRYAADNHITVMPEIDVPGHARAAIKSMEARYRRFMALGDEKKASEYRLVHPDDSSSYQSIQHFDDNVVDPALPSTYHFIRTVASDLAAMYEKEGLKLEILHLGGDEVPKNVWQGSPAIQSLKQTNPLIQSNHDLFTYFFQKNSEILAELHIRLAGWEEIGMGADYSSSPVPTPLSFIWNNVWGWERESLAYQLANTGNPVVLCNVTNLYFDLAYDKDPEEEGLYWGGFVDTRTVYEFTPENLSRCAWQGHTGNPVPASLLNSLPQLTEEGIRNIWGIQGQLWSERLLTPDRLQYMAAPKLLALAERAWAPKPAWAEVEKDSQRLSSLDREWARFASTLGQKELPRLDRLSTGPFHYRIPLPGLKVENRKIHANILYPGLTIRYSSDGSVPGPDSPAYQTPLDFNPDLVFAAFTSDGRSSRPVKVSTVE